MMIGNILADEHIRDLVQSGGLKILSTESSQLAYSYLVKHFPIHSIETTSIIDWKRVIHHNVLDWAQSTDDEAAIWSKKTLAGNCSLGMLFYSKTDPSVLGPFEFMIRNLDTLIWGYPGCKLLFGVEKSEHGTLVFTSGIIETDGNEYLFASQAETS
jgi:hypothetical protein